MHKLLFGIILSALAPASVSAATLFLSTPSATVSVGQTFDVLIQVDSVFDPPRAGDEVIGFGFDITNLNSAAFNLLGFTVGPLFEDFSPLPDTVVYALVTGTPITDPLASPPLLLATLHFLAIDAGVGQIGVASNLLDLNEGLQYLSSASATVPLNGSLTITSIPEPSSYLLISIGFVVLYGVEWRRKRTSDFRCE